MKRMVGMLMVLAVGGAVARGQTRLPVQVTVQKKEETNRVIVQTAELRHGQGVDYHRPEISERKQKVALKIGLLNMAFADLPGSTVKYQIIAKGKSITDLAIAGEGEQTVDLPPSRVTTVETKPVEMVVTETAFKKGAFADRNEREGYQYYGVFVTVRHGNDSTTFAEPKDLAGVIKDLKPVEKPHAPPRGKPMRVENP